MSKRKLIRKILPICAGILIFVFLIAFKFDLSSLATTISSKISWGFYIFISLLVVLQMVIRSLRFNLLFNYVFEDRMSLKDSFLLTGASFFVAMATPNKLGDTARGLFFREKGVEVTAIALIEYLFDTFVIVGIALMGVVFVYRQYLSTFILLLVIAAAGCFGLFCVIKSSRVKTFAERLSWYHKIQDKALVLKGHFTTGIKSKFVLSLGFISSCFFIMVYFLIFYLVLCRLGAAPSVTDVVFSTGVGMLIGALTFIPMGMGTRDISTYGLLQVVGIAPEIAISSVIIMRSLSITLLLVCGLCYFLTLGRFSRKK